MSRTFTLAILLLVVFRVNAQEDSLWKPSTHITGYVNTIAEYNDLKLWKDNDKSTGIGLAEAAFLVSYKPYKNLEFKGTFVYTHYIQNIQSLLVEAYATYTVDSRLKLSAGKYLTPLSPVNQYFYAPMNPSASLPMIVAHHFLLPQSVSGFQIHGEFGNDFKAGYNFTYGHYMTIGHGNQGILGIQGAEERAVFMFENETPPEYHLGGSARVFCNYNDILNVGLNYFDGRHSTQVVSELKNNAWSTFMTPAEKYTAGVDVQLKAGGLKLNAEYWIGEQKTTKLDAQIKNKYKGYYGEAIYDIGVFSPYLRYDYIEDLKSTVYFPFPTTTLFKAEWPCNTYTIGIAARPIYEVLLKMEYKYVKSETKYSDVNIPVPLQTAFPPDNPLKINEDKYNYLVFSLVYSF